VPPTGLVRNWFWVAETKETGETKKMAELPLETCKFFATTTPFLTGVFKRKVTAGPERADARWARYVVFTIG
jgi:hypothetical protein